MQDHFNEAQRFGSDANKSVKKPMFTKCKSSRNKRPPVQILKTEKQMMAMAGVNINRDSMENYYDHFDAKQMSATPMTASTLTESGKSPLRKKQSKSRLESKSPLNNAFKSIVKRANPIGTENKRDELNTKRKTFGQKGISIRLADQQTSGQKSENNHNKQNEFVIFDNSRSQHDFDNSTLQRDSKPDVEIMRDSIFKNKFDFDKERISTPSNIERPLTEWLQKQPQIFDAETKYPNAKSHRSQKSYLSKENTTKIRKDLNKFCIECQEKDPEWVSINNGIFVCLHCSAYHRGYGVQISFVRSLEMDQYDELELRMLKKGGNRKFLEFIQIYMIQNEDSDRHSKYFKRACALYREKLQFCAEHNLEFTVDSSWFDELSIVDGQEMVQNYHSRIANVKRRYESSPMRNFGNFTQYLTEKFVALPASFQQKALRSNYCATPLNCCRTKAFVMHEANEELRYSQIMSKMPNIENEEN